MANVSGAGTLWNLPNLDGELFTKTHSTTPFIDRIGAVRISNNSEYSMSSSDELETAAQPAITETASLTAPTPVSYVRDNELNAAQIFQRKVSVSYQKLSNSGRMRYVESGTSGYGYSTYDGTNPVADELRYQVEMNLKNMRTNMEHTFLQGTYQKSTSAAVAWKTKGIITGSTTNTVAAGSVDLSQDLVGALANKMADNAAPFPTGRYIAFCNSFQKRKFSEIYTYSPTSRTEGGSNILTVYTDFFTMDVVFDPFMPTDTVLIADMNKCALVLQPVPGKSTVDQNVVLEPLSKGGAGEDWQLYLQAGIDYGSSYFHGTLTGLTTS